MIKKLTINTPKQGLHAFTDTVEKAVKESGVEEGLCTLFIQHTSASLLIQENYDYSAQVDLENWMNRLVPENDPLYTHTLEGEDDMPAHIKTTLTSTHLSIPIYDGKLALGTWQGIYLWEHRYGSHKRHVVAHIANDAK